MRQNQHRLLCCPDPGNAGKQISMKTGHEDQETAIGNGVTFCDLIRLTSLFLQRQ